MRKIRFFIPLLLLSQIFLNGFSQYKKNAVVFEALGKSLYYFDISYERYLSEKFHFGTGLGIGGGDHLYSEGGGFYRYNFTIPVYCSYTLGPKKHHVITELGITLSLATGPRTSLYFDDPFPFISCGYEYKREFFFFRAQGYLGYVGRNEFFPSVFPWAGLSVGRLF